MPATSSNSTPSASPRSASSDGSSAPSTPHTPSSASSNSKLSKEERKALKAEHAAEKKAAKDARNADRAVRRAEKEQRRADKKDRKSKTGTLKASDASSSAPPTTDTADVPVSPKKKKKTKSSTPRSDSTSAPKVPQTLSVSVGSTSTATSTATHTATTAPEKPNLTVSAPIVPPKPAKLSPSTSPGPRTPTPPHQAPPLSPSSHPSLRPSINAGPPTNPPPPTTIAAPTPTAAAPVPARKLPPQPPVASSSPRPGLSRGQSALLNVIGQNKNAAAPQVLPAETAVSRVKVKKEPFYRLIQLESDVKPLTDQSTASDYPILVQDEVARLLSDFANTTVVTASDKHGSPDIAFEKLSRLAVPIVGMHGNKYEMIKFLTSRVASLERDLVDLFDKPGLYAVVGQSLPDADAKSPKLKRNSSVKKPRRTKSSIQPSSGQLILYIVLWHTSDAYLQMFTTSNRTLQLFAFMHQICTHRLVFYSETEARYLTRLDNELISLRQDWINMRTLPELLRDNAVKTRVDGGILFGKTTTIHMDRYLLRSLLSVGTFGDQKQLYEGRGAHLPDIEFIGGTHSIAFRVTSRAASASEALSSATPNGNANTSTMVIAIESVPNLLAQWGASGTIELSNLTPDEFDAILTDGQAADWKAKTAQIADERERVESSIAVPKYESMEQLVDSAIRAHLRTNEQTRSVDKFFDDTARSMPQEDRLTTFASVILDDASLARDQSGAIDEQLLQTYGQTLGLETLRPEMPCLVALSRFALAKCALRLVRVLKNKSPAEQASFIINTMDSSEEEVNGLLESLRAYPEFEKAHSALFSSSADLSKESDERIRWYFMTLYDNAVVQTRHYMIHTLSESGNTLEKLQGTRRGGEQMAEFEKWRNLIISEYRNELSARLESIFDFKLLSNSATGQATGHLARQHVLSYKRDAAAKSVTLSLRSDAAQQQPTKPRSTSAPRQIEEEMRQHSVINFCSTNWMASASASSVPVNSPEFINASGVRVSPSTCKTFFTPSNSHFATPHHASLYEPSAALSSSDCSTHLFYCSSLNIVITVVTRKEKRETQIFAAGGALVGTLPVYCTHVGYSEESQLIALCGDYIQLFRLLDGCRALSTAPLISFYLDANAYGTLEQVHVVGEECYFYTSLIVDNPAAQKPALPPRPDLAGAPKPAAPAQPTTSKACLIFRATAAGACVRLSPGTGVAPFDSLIVFPTHAHLLLVRSVGGAKGLEGELWQLNGLAISVFVDIPLSDLVGKGDLPSSDHSSNPNLDDSLVHSLRLVSLNGSLHLVNCSRPCVSNGSLAVKLHMMRLGILSTKGDAAPDVIIAAETVEMRKTNPCENYLSYFAESVLKYSPAPAAITHILAGTNRNASGLPKPLRVLVGTKDAGIAAEFENFVDRHRILLRFAMLSSEKLNVARATRLEPAAPMKRELDTSPQMGTQPPTGAPEPVVPYFHHTNIKVRTIKSLAVTKEDWSADVALISLATVARVLISAVPVPIVASTTRGALVASLNGGAEVLPHAEVVALETASRRAQNAAPSSRPPTSVPSLISSKISFGLIESLIRSWPSTVKIVSSFGACGTGKTSLMNHVFGTMFETSEPHYSPFFISDGLHVDVKPPRAGMANPVGAFMSVVPTPTTLFIVLDFESILTNKPVAEQSLLAVFNFVVSNMTIWRSTTPFVAEHYETLRTFSMVKERLRQWTKNDINKPMLPWPKSFNSLLMVSDTQRLADLSLASKAHFDISKAAIKHFENKPGPHSRPVMQSMVSNRFATIALPLKNFANATLSVTAKNWKLGPMNTNYTQQDAVFYQALSDHVAPFLEPVLSFDSGIDALSHIKKHLSYVLWSQTSTQDLPPRLDEAITDLDILSQNALVFGQQIRIGDQGGSSKLSADRSQANEAHGNDYVRQRTESLVNASGQKVTIGPLCDLSDPSRVVGCPQLEFSLFGIPEHFPLDFDRLQQYFPEEGLVIPIGRDPLPFNPQSKIEWSYYSYIDAILQWNRHVYNREAAFSDYEWTTSLQFFINALITRRALRVDYWITIHTADIPPSSPLYKRVTVLREKIACWFDKIISSWALCGQPCPKCYYTCTLQKGHNGEHDCLVPNQHACTSLCPNCQRHCPVQAGHGSKGIYHKCPVNCNTKH